MESANTNHEDKDNEGNINISSCRAQDVGVYCYTNLGFANNGPNHQSIKERASLPKDHNTVTNDNHQNMTPPRFDKEELSAMQTQVLQGRMQPSTTYLHNEMAKDRVPIGPVKRQVAEAWNNQRKKKKHEALNLTMETT
jgi:hypothetical protein